MSSLFREMMVLVVVVVMVHDVSNTTMKLV